MIRSILVALTLSAASCAHITDLGMFYTERGLASAEAEWDMHYYKKLMECKSRFDAESDGAKACFYATFKMDKEVEIFVEESMRILREYWKLRAHGYEPSLEAVMVGIEEAVGKLPRNARRYFERVRGLGYAR